MNTRKIAFVLLMLTVTMVNPGCKHGKPDAKVLYQKYLKSKIVGYSH